MCLILPSGTSPEPSGGGRRWVCNKTGPDCRCYRLSRSGFRFQPTGEETSQQSHQSPLVPRPEPNLLIFPAVAGGDAGGVEVRGERSRPGSSSTGAFVGLTPAAGSESRLTGDPKTNRHLRHSLTCPVPESQPGCMSLQEIVSALLQSLRLIKYLADSAGEVSGSGGVIPGQAGDASRRLH